MRYGTASSRGHFLPGIHSGSSAEGGRGESDAGKRGREATNPYEREDLSGVPVTRNLNYYVEGRLFEWTMALATLICGVEFAIWEDALTESAFHFLLLLMTRYEVSFILISLGWSRATALMLNGQSLFGYRVGPWVRAVCCVFSAMMWVQFFVALSFLSYDIGHPSPGLPFWGMFTLAELYAAYLVMKNG